MTDREKRANIPKSLGEALEGDFDFDLEPPRIGRRRINPQAPTSTLTSRELNQDVGRAKRAAERGPVVITDRGRPKHVLMTYAAYRRLAGRQLSAGEALEHKEGQDIDFDAPKLGALFRPVDFEE